MLDEDEKFFKKNGIPLFSSHMIDLVCLCCSALRPPSNGLSHTNWTSLVCYPMSSIVPSRSCLLEQRSQDGIRGVC